MPDPNYLSEIEREDGTILTIKDAEARAALADKQDTIDSTHKLPSDNVDDTNQTHKFATQAQLDQIGTNATDIAAEQAKTTGMTEGGSDYITVGGIRVYASATQPTGDIPVGSLWIGG